MVGLLAVLAAGCTASPGPEAGPARVDVRAASLKEGFGTMDRLVEAAKKEGSLTVIGLARDWANYGEIIAAFRDAYGIEVKSVEPTASSRRQIAVADTVKPDVFDLTLDVAVANAHRFARYRTTTWQDIPDHLKDPAGAWYAAYGGYMSIGYDPRRVPAPRSFADLTRPGYKVALPGDPRQAAAAFSAVMAASLRTGRPDAKAGVDLFARLRAAGALVPPAQATAVVDWDHRNAAYAAEVNEGRDEPVWQVVVPADAVLGAYHVQAINKNAPHPAAARLWQEFLFSDEGQNLFLKGYARPVRMEAMQMNGTLDTEAAARLPRAPGAPVLLTVPEIDKARSYIRTHWAAR